METIIGKNLDFTLIGDSFEDLKYKEEQSGKDEPCECKEPCSNLKRV